MAIIKFIVWMIFCFGAGLTCPNIKELLLWRVPMILLMWSVIYPL